MTRYALWLEQTRHAVMVEADTLAEAIAQAEADSGGKVMAGHAVDADD